VQGYVISDCVILFSVFAFSKQLYTCWYWWNSWW